MVTSAGVRGADSSASKSDLHFLGDVNHFSVLMGLPPNPSVIGEVDTIRRAFFTTSCVVNYLPKADLSINKTAHTEYNLTHPNSLN